MTLPRLLVPLVTAALLAACGGDSGSGSGTTPAPAPAVDAPPAESTPPAVPAPAQDDARQSLSAASLEALARYRSEAEAYVKALDRGDSAEELAARSGQLVELAETVLPDFLALRPGCSDYLNAALDLKTRWQSLTVAEIEAGYHQDGQLPAPEGGDAHAGGCYHMKDLLVHPITAQAALAENPDDRDAAQREIAEVITHVAVVEALQHTP